VRRRKRGFTLIELIIAITLVAAIAAGLLFSMHTSLLTMERTQARLDQNRRASAIQQLVYSQLGGAIPATGLCGGSTTPIFRGDQSQLLMVTTYSREEGARGYPRVVSYRAEPEPGGTFRLVTDEFLFSGPASTNALCLPGGVIRPIASTERTLVIASGLAYCRFHYRLMVPFTGLGGAWQETWIYYDLPAAIRIDLAPARPDPSGMPVVPITVPLHVNRQYGEIYADY
jgi:prepilin-type N-terminal cleavage/methylation domain-containing protein